MDIKKKIILFSLIFGIVVFLLISFAVYPLIKTIRKNSEEFILAKKELITFHGETGKFEQFKESYKDLEPDLEKLDRLFVDSDVPIELVKFWQGIAGDSGLSVDISSVSIKTLESDPWNSLGFQMKLASSLPSFLKFLERVETAPYLIEIQNLVAKKETTAEDNPGVDVSLVIKVYTK